MLKGKEKENNMKFIPYAWSFANIADRLYGEISSILKDRDIIPIEYHIDRGYIAIGEEDIVISYQGSKEFKDWLSDADLYPLKGGMEAAYDLIKNGRSAQDVLHHSGILKEGKWGRGIIHDGFYTAWRGFKPKIYAQFKDLNRNKPVKVFGHSRGGTIAELTARHIKKNLGFKDVSFVGFGNPRIGISKYRDEYNKLGIDATNVRNGIDIVSCLPYKAMGFRHVGKMKRIKYNFFHNIARWNKFKDHFGWSYTRGIKKKWGE